MKCIVVIGMDLFGQAVAQELAALKVELVIIDSIESRVEAWKDTADACFVVGSYEPTLLGEILPKEVDWFVIDLGGSIEASILLTHNLKKMGYGNIMVRAQSSGHGEIVEALGATRVVFPDKQAAKRLVPSMVASGLLSYTPMGSNLAFAEIPVPDEVAGLSLRDAQFRSRYGLTIVACRGMEQSTTVEYLTMEADQILDKDLVLLVSGTPETIEKMGSIE